MRRAWLGLLVLTLALYSASPRAMRALAIVQGHVGHPLAANPIAQAFSSTATGGNLVVVYVGMTGQTVTSVTDDKSSCSGYTQVPTAAMSHEDVWYCANVISGAQTITVNFSGSPTQTNVGLFEISGAAASSLVDVMAQASPASSTTPSGAAITTLYDHTIVTTAFRDDNTSASVTGLHAGNAFSVTSLD